MKLRLLISVSCVRWWSSASLVVRGALVEKGGHAFLLVLRVEEPLEQAPLERKSRLQRDVGAEPNRLADRLDRQWRHRGDPRREVDAVRQRFTLRHEEAH